MTTSHSNRLPQFSSWRIFPVIFAAIFLLHAPLLRLPFFWDEAGFYVPAAYDLAHFQTLLPQTTMDTGHPPLSAAYLALWFAVSGWKPAVARIAMLLLAAFALTNVFLVARRLAGTGVAVATTIATSVYPAFAFSLAVLSKETAVITPLALALWEVLQSRDDSGRTRLYRTAAALVPVAPLLAWFFYHHHETGRFFGNAEFYQYNVTQALSPLRFLLALGMRTWHLLGNMNMLALTAATVVAMFYPPVTDESAERGRIAVPVQRQFALIMLAHVFTFSLLGGAMLTRYMLPVYPLVIMIGMSTLHRRIARWEWPAAAMIIFFVLALFFDPPYRIAPEDNLTYKDFVELHVRAARFLEQHEQNTTVLAAWPATDELTKPYLGYVHQPFQVFPARDFTVESLLRARPMRSQYQVAYLFSTKYETSTWFHSESWEKLNRRFFDYHRDVSPETAAELLGGRVVFLARSKGEWVEIVEIEQPSSVASSTAQIKH